jgi:hypothetical protein
MPRRSRVATLLVVVLASAVADIRAHKPITSKFDYENDVLPLFRDHCSRCHAPDGAAPMSLMTYADAVPWAESIRDEMTSGRMPPWPVDPRSPRVKGAHPIDARAIDTIVTWATGGTPQGQLPSNRSGPHRAQPRAGPPDLVLPMPSIHVVAAGTLDEICDYSIATGLAESRWVRAADLIPGTPSMVRDAVISIEDGPVLAVWQPGDVAIQTPTGTGFQLPARATLHLQIHYKKHFDQEQQAIADRSAVALYFAASSAVEVRELTIPSPSAKTESFRILGVRPMLDGPYDSMMVDVVTADGTRKPVLLLQSPRPQWFRRYWLETPIDIPADSHLEVHLTPLSANEDEPRQSRRFASAIWIAYMRR